MNDEEIDTLLNERPVAETNETLESSPGLIDTHATNKLFELLHKSLRAYGTQGSSQTMALSSSNASTSSTPPVINTVNRTDTA